jgi:SAM-dependent methyltransferase
VQPSVSKPTPAPAIQVMRIIAIGTPGSEPTALAEDDVEEIPSELDHDEATPPLIQVATGERAPQSSSEDLADAAEIPDEDVAPDSQDEATTGVVAKAEKAEKTDGKPAAAAAVDGEEATELGRDDALSIPPDFPDTEAASMPAGQPAPSEQKPPSAPTPPPPPRRAPSPPRRSDSGRPRARRTLKRPWWEDIFGEDFSRAVPRLTDKQVAREVDFIEESLGVAKGGVVLDLGCGAGYQAVELASRGYGVVGYDLSVYQLALAADVAQERDQKINFLQGDMREMAFEAMFDGIYCWNTSFGYFEEEKNLAVAERVFRALKPGGMFLIDVANRDFAASYSPSQLWYEGDSCVCMDDMSVDFISSRLRVKRSVIFDDGRSRECTYSIRLYSLHELGKLLHDVGFRVTEASGRVSTPGVFFGELSPRLIVLAQKP